MEKKFNFKSVKRLTNLGFNELEAVVEDINPVDGKLYDKRMSVPPTLDNIHYAEIKRQVDAGELTIEDAD
tara:strand:+ start:53 stop:262 length:210 start_codon:yes stop_codon:yes gene_type:complete